MYTKKNGRVSYRSGKRSNFKRNNTFINKSRNKGNVTQQYNKYLKLAKEASSSGDRIQTEYFYQFADHYSRLMIDLGVVVEGNDINQSLSNEKIATEKIVKDDSNGKNESIDTSTKEIEDDNPEDHGSIEAVPFISKPARKKSIKTKK